MSNSKIALRRDRLIAVSQRSRIYYSSLRSTRKTASKLLSEPAKLSVSLPSSTAGNANIAVVVYSVLPGQGPTCLGSQKRGAHVKTRSPPELAAMEDRHPASQESRAAIVRMPAEIDIANAGQLVAELAAACDSGASVVVADMTSTTFCDASGARMLVVAQKRATESGAELRAAVGSARVRRVLILLGIDTIVPIHPTIDAACRTDQRRDKHITPRG